jgi:hypothetical protein
MERDVATTFLASITIRCFSGSVRGQKRWKRVNQWIKVQRNLYKEEAGRKEDAAGKSGVNIKSGVSSDVESSTSGAGSSVGVESGVIKEGDLPFSGSRLDSVFSENKPEKHAPAPPSGVTFAAHEFPHHPTVVMLFQEIDGVDVCLFAMYVNEFGSDCPPPNRNKVYISYLDSANFMQPSCFRTPVYHELMLGYLQDAKARGFSSVYIWACPPPPRAGDSYILSVHPKWQRTPNTERLVKWYKSIEELALKEKILVSSEGILDAHFNGHRQFRATRHSKGRMGRNKGSKRAKTEAVPPPASNGRSSVPVDTTGSRRRGGARRGGISNSGALTAPPSEDSSGSLPALSSSVPPEAAATQQNKRQCLQESDDATLAARDAIASVYQIPYFSGDFWVGEVEKLLFELDGYGLPGDPDAAMRYWWQQQAKLLKRREAAAAGKPLPPTPKPKPRTPSPKPNYPRTLRAVLPEDSNSSLLYFARKTLQTASSSSSSSSSSSASEPDAQPGQVRTYKRYNVVRFRMMDSDMSAILTRRIEDQAYTRAVIRRIEEEEAKAKRLAAIPTHKPTFEEREAWIMSHLKTRISPMADQFLVWHLNPECYYCGKVVSRGKCWLYEATIAKTPGKPKLRRYLCTSCHKIPRAKAELHVLLGQAGAKKNSHHKKKPLVNISPYDVPVAGAPPAGSRGARAQHRIPEVPKSSIFDTRMGVLAYAQRMGFQFDQLRRAKHSSMMLLLQLHRSMLKQEKAQVGQVSKAGKRVGVRQSL